MTKSSRSDARPTAPPVDLAQRLLETLAELPFPKGYLIAFSGGLDSTVLLHLMARLRNALRVPVRAVHVHHGLHSEADHWARHCRETCERLSIPIVVERVSVQAGPRQSLEAVAREARYRAIARALGRGEMLLLAQHADDQAETLLLQLLRGAGVEGMAAMPRIREWHGGWMARPLIGFTRETLLQWARQSGLIWLEDPSNEDKRIARNYLRHEVMPVLRRRWPGMARTLGRSARHSAEAARMLEELAAADLAEAATENRWQLRLEVVSRLSGARRRNLLRRWMKMNRVTPPPERVMGEVDVALLGADAGRAPELHWKAGALRRYRNRLYLFPGPLPAVPRGQEWQWQGDVPLRLPAGLGELKPFHTGSGKFPATGVTVRFGAGRLRCRPAGRQGSRSFKRLCQDLGIPPWLRPRLPLLVVEGQLAAVADYCWCHPHGDLQLEWVRPDWLR